MRLDRTQREHLKRVLLLILLTVAVLRFIVIPGKESLKKNELLLESQLQKYQRTKLQLEKLKRESSEVRRGAEGIRDEIPTYLYPSQADPLEIQLTLLKNLLSVLQKKELVLQGFSLPSISYGKTITEIPLELRFQGRARDVLSFLEYLEKQEKRIYIRDCTITETARRLSVTMTITVIKSEI